MQGSEQGIFQGTVPAVAHGDSGKLQELKPVQPYTECDSNCVLPNMTHNHFHCHHTSYNSHIFSM